MVAKKISVLTYVRLTIMIIFTHQNTQTVDVIPVGALSNEGWEALQLSKKYKAIWKRESIEKG